MSPGSFWNLIRIVGVRVLYAYANTPQGRVVEQLISFPLPFLFSSISEMSSDYFNHFPVSEMHLCNLLMFNIHVLQVVGVCDRLLINAGGSAGSAGRPLLYFWSVSADTSQVVSTISRESWDREIERSTQKIHSSALYIHDSAVLTVRELLFRCPSVILVFYRSVQPQPA